jgi:hypothetical protein
VRLLHALAKMRASFDDPNLVSHGGLVLLAALAERAGLHALAAHVRPDGDRGANAGLKVASSPTPGALTVSSAKWLEAGLPVLLRWSS